MDAALLWLLIAAWSRGGATPRSGAPRRETGAHVRRGRARGTAEREGAAPLHRRLHARSAWLRALEEVGLVDRRMKPSPIRKLW